VHLVGAAFAIAYFKFRWNLGNVTARFSSWGDRAKTARARRRFRIHDPDKDWKQDQEADRILDKVNREGMDSLTSKEKRALEEYSRRVRKKRGSSG
jgi:hypothetical protein